MSTSPPSSPDPIRKARHDVRGKMNAVKLCMSALEVINNPKDKAEFLAMLADAADKLIEALDHFDVISPEDTGEGS